MEQSDDYHNSTKHVTVEEHDSRDSSYVECPVYAGSLGRSSDPDENGDTLKLNCTFLVPQEKSFDLDSVREPMDCKSRRTSGTLEARINEEDRVLMDTSSTDHEKLAYAIELLQHYRHRTRSAETEAQTRANYMQKMEEDIASLSEIVQTQRTKLFEREVAHDHDSHDSHHERQHNQGREALAEENDHFVSRANTMGTMCSLEIQAQSVEDVPIPGPSKSELREDPDAKSNNPTPAKGMLQINVLKSKIKTRDQTIKEITTKLDTLKTSHSQLRKLLLDREAIIEKLQHQIRGLEEWKAYTKEHTICSLQFQVEELVEWKANHQASNIATDFSQNSDSPASTVESKIVQKRIQSRRRGRHRIGESMDLLDLSLLPENPPRLAFSNPTSPEKQKLEVFKKFGGLVNDTLLFKPLNAQKGSSGIITPNSRIKKLQKPVFTPTKSRFSFSKASPKVYAESPPKKKGWFW
mmetsp:Transcript_9080/g.17769  ORF Transcript_9080/g.17769 Transcript_9080/m.17769 type:complete len:466 (-) Transcript_9080:156-1553(-)